MLGLHICTIQLGMQGLEACSLPTKNLHYGLRNLCIHEMHVIVSTNDVRRAPLAWLVRIGVNEEGRWASRWSTRVDSRPAHSFQGDKGRLQ